MPQERIRPEWREQYEHKRQASQLRVDLVRAFDQLFELKKKAHHDRALLRSALQRTSQELQREKIKTWILAAVVTGELTIIGWLVKAFLDRFGS